MTEKEKQQAGELYNSRDPELVADRVKANKFCLEYNRLPCNDYIKRQWMLDRLVALRGENTIIESDFFCDYGYNIVIGNNFHADQNLNILDSADIIFGDNVFIGPNCTFYTSERPLDCTLRNQGFETAKPIKVGNNVCLRGNVCVLPGVTIGDNVVIETGSVVTEDIPSNTYASGNPCKEVSKLEAPKIVPEEKTPADEESAAEDNKSDAPAETPKNDEKKRFVKLVEVKK